MLPRSLGAKPVPWFQRPGTNVFLGTSATPSLKYSGTSTPQADGQVMSGPCQGPVNEWMVKAPWDRDPCAGGVQLFYWPTRKPKASLQSSELEDRKIIFFNYKNVTFVFTKVIQWMVRHFTGRYLQMKRTPRRTCFGLFSTMAQIQPK